MNQNHHDDNGDADANRVKDTTQDDDKNDHNNIASTNKNTSSQPTPGAYSMTDSSTNNSSSNNNQLSNHEADILAKQKGRSNIATGVHQATNTKKDDEVRSKEEKKGRNLGMSLPGAHSVTGNNNRGTTTPTNNIRNYEADIVAKQTASRTVRVTTNNNNGGTTTPTNNVRNYEADIIAKQTASGRIRSGTIEPGAHSVNHTTSGTTASHYEASIRAKQTAGASHSSTSNHDIQKQKLGRSNHEVVEPGAYSTMNNNHSNPNSEETSALRKHEADILSKQIGRSMAVRATTPGAHSTTDIPTKQNQHSTMAVPTPSAYASTSKSDSMKSTPTVLRQHEADIRANQIHHLTTDAKPGAHSTTGISDNSTRTSSMDIRSLEVDIAAKMAAKRSITVPTPGVDASVAILTNDTITVIPTDVRSHEADILAKQAARRSSILTNSSSHSKADLRGHEDDILAKQIASASRLSSSVDNNSQVLPGSMPSDHDIRSQKKDNSSIANKKASNDARQLENDLMIKQTASASRNTASSADSQQFTAERNLLVSDGFDNLENHIITSNRDNTNNASMGNISFNLRDLETQIEVKKATVDEIANSSMNEVTGNTEDNAGKYLDDASAQNSISYNANASVDAFEYGEFGLPNNDGMLAVATAVSSEEENLYLPSAIEFDPDAKPSIYRNRRFRLYVYLMIAASICGISGAILGIVLTQNEYQPHVPYRTTLGIRENIGRIISKDLLDDPLSPYRKALDWIMFTDRMQLTPDNSTLFPRYILAYLYFATSETSKWTSDCAPSDGTSITKDDCTYEYTTVRFGDDDLQRRTPALRWLSNTDECEWGGVYCDQSNQIQSIIISNVGMSGSFPEGITLLPYLQILELAFGTLEGSIPSAIGSIRNLHRLSLEKNQFTGEIPDSLLQQRTMTILQVRNNKIEESLSSVISSGKLETLIELDMSANLITGSIPDALFSSNIQLVTVDNNQLNGTIPTTIGMAKHIKIVSFSNNQLTGQIPTEIGGARKLWDFVMTGNRLSGTIPDTLFDLPALVAIYLNDNSLRGTVSNRISKLQDLLEVDISYNEFSGTLPERYNSQVPLNKYHGQGNQFNGTVSTQLCNLVYKGQLKEFALDCLVPSSGDLVPEISCPCCTKCCSADGITCIENEVK